MQIPVTGMPKEQGLGTLQAFKARDMDWKAGKVWCYVYNPGDETAELVRQAYLLFLTRLNADRRTDPGAVQLAGNRVCENTECASHANSAE